MVEHLFLRFLGDEAFGGYEGVYLLIPIKNQLSLGNG